MALFDLFSLPTWRDYLRPASFRGVPFHVRDHRFTGGRAVGVHVFPLREEIATEDLGVTPKKYEVTAYVIGDDYMVARNALVDACINQPGAGLLVHPFLNQVLVRCENCSFTESLAEGGVAAFTLGFIEAGGQKAFLPEQDTQAASIAALRQVLQLARAAFGLAMGIRNWSAFIRSAFKSAVSSLASDLAGGLLGLPGLDPVGIAESIAGLGSADVNNPEALSAAVVAPFQAVTDAAAALPLPAASASAAEAGAGSSAVTSRGEESARQGWVGTELLRWAGYAVPPVASAGAASLGTVNSNNAALAALVADAAVASAAQAFLQARFADAGQAEAAFTALSAAMAQRGAAAADRFRDDLWSAWQAAEALVQRDFSQRLRQLPSLGSYALPQPMPSLVLAQRLYQAPARADELVALNAAPHPMFLPAAGKALNA